MTLSLDDLLLPLLTQQLKNLKQWLGKAEMFAQSQGISPNDILSARLHPNMYPFSKQVLLAAEHALSAATRLSGTEGPDLDSTLYRQDTTLDILHQTLDRTLRFLQHIPHATFSDAEERTITLDLPWGSESYPAVQYVHAWVIPHFMFHVSTGYCILRHLGVPMGKADLLGSKNPS